MTGISWSTWDGVPCLRVCGVATAAEVSVRPAGAGRAHGRPATAGRFVRHGEDLCFVPRFPFLAGTEYEVEVDGDVIGTATRAAGATSEPTTEVVAIRPTAAAVPRNLLRCYVEFSAPMREAGSAHVRLVGDDGSPLGGALLSTEYELWDRERRRLTVLLDPARIKRGLVAHQATGYPLRPDTAVSLVVDADFPDASGRPLRTRASRTWQVVGDERRRVTPASWTVMPVSAGTTEPLIVMFDRSLDHALVARCLHVMDAEARVVGSVEVGDEERSWRFTPSSSWVAVPHCVVVDPVLEDVAGNSVQRVFDRDLTIATETPRRGGSVELPFLPT